MRFFFICFHKLFVLFHRDNAPGQRECDEALEQINYTINQLDQASLAAISQVLEPRPENSLQVHAIECVRSCDKKPYLHNETKGGISIKIEFNPQKNISLLQHDLHVVVLASYITYSLTVRTLVLRLNICCHWYELSAYWLSKSGPQFCNHGFQSYTSQEIFPWWASVQRKETLDQN